MRHVLLRGRGPVPVSVDAVSSGARAALSAAVAMILTLVGHLTPKGARRPFVQSVLWKMNGLFAFGALVAATVAWRRAVGTVETVSAVALKSW